MGILEAPSPIAPPGDRITIPGPPIGLIIRATPPIVKLGNQIRHLPEKARPATVVPPTGNLGNCQGQITVTYYVKDSPVVET